MEISDREKKKKMVLLEPTKENKLPPELIMEILSWVPVNSLFRFRCVSKEWLRFLTIDTHFINELHVPRLLTANSVTTFPSLISRVRTGGIHLTYGPDYAADVDVKKIDLGLPIIQHKKTTHYHLVGTCNGLLCLAIYEDQSTSMCSKPPSELLIWNPLTREHATLSFSQLPSHLQNCNVIFGFGYHQATTQYKVVRIHDSREGLYTHHVSVYTLGDTNSSWRTLPDVSCLFSSFSTAPTVNGTPHWLVATVGSRHITAFDIETETFKDIPLPFECEVSFQVKELCGLLSIVYQQSVHYFGMWVMKEYGVASTWTHLLTIRISDIPKDFGGSGIRLSDVLAGFGGFSPIGFPCNGEITITTDSPAWVRSLTCSPKTNTFKEPTKFKCYLHGCGFCTFVGSLVSPEIINGGARQVTVFEESGQQS